MKKKIINFGHTIWYKCRKQLFLIQKRSFYQKIKEETLSMQLNTFNIF